MANRHRGLNPHFSFNDENYATGNEQQLVKMLQEEQIQIFGFRGTYIVKTSETIDQLYGESIGSTYKYSFPIEFMPENNQLLSVESQLVGLPLAGPESFSQAQLDYLKRALGVDETVLFTGTFSASTGSTFNISEAVTNFEKIEIWAVRSPSDNSYCIERFSPNNQYISMTSNYVNIGDSQQNMYCMRLKFSDTTVTVQQQSVKAFAASAYSTNTSSPMTICKVVGIHRIAGGN
jgi:hypothetical protein